MKLIVAEKKNVALKLAEVLGPYKEDTYHLVLKDYILVWAQGHLIELVDPEVYDVSFKRWSLKTLPILPEPFILRMKSDKKTKDIYRVIKHYMQDPDIDEIYCATDAGREGQLIFEWIYMQTKCTKPVRRLWFSSLEHNELKAAFTQSKDNSEYKGYYTSASARAKADWLIGMNFSRLYKIKYGSFSKQFKGLNVGRVQTPTLAKIVERELSIESFERTTYYEIEAEFSNFKAKYVSKSMITDRTIAESIFDTCLNQKALVESVQANLPKTELAPKLYNLLHLQKDAFKRHHFSPKDTSTYAQKLYEKGLITYPRTDAQFLNESFHDVYASLLKMIPTVLSEAEPRVLRLINDGFNLEAIIGKVSDHHAIILTSEVKGFDVSTLSDGELKCFKLIAHRMITAVDQPYITIKHTVNLNIAQHKFSSDFKEIKQMGWRENQSEIVEVSQHVNLKEEDVLEPLNLSLLVKETKPQSRFNYSTLLSYMESPKTFDLTYTEAIQDVALGTEATRADILASLVKNHYLYINTSKEIVPTFRGKSLIRVMTEELKSPELTQKWEYQLKLILENTFSEDTFISELKNYITNHVDMIKSIK